MIKGHFEQTPRGKKKLVSSDIVLVTLKKKI